jgi:integrase/recombinase XerD
MYASKNSLEYYYERYLKYLTDEKNYSMHTIQVNRLSLAAFIRWTDDCGYNTIMEITKAVLDNYQKYLSDYRKKNGDKLEVSTRKNRISKLRSFFSWSYRNNFVLYNPAVDLQLPKGESRLPRNVLSQSEARLILSKPDTSIPLGIRDKAILEVFYSTGIRKSELLNLTINDINYTREILAVRKGKWNKDRVVPVGKSAIFWVKKYLKDVHPIFISRLSSKPDRIFLGKWGRPLAGDTLHGIVADYIRKAGVDKKASCHIFRHSMATHMLENGADVRYVQQMLGHVSVETTKIYTHVAIDKLKEIHKTTHPGNLVNVKHVKIPKRRKSRAEAPGNINERRKNTSPEETNNTNRSIFSLVGLVKEFLANKKAQNYSDRTINNYGYDLNIFISWCEKNRIENITSINLDKLKKYQSYINRLKNRQTDEVITLKSRLNLLSSLRAFFYYLYKNNHILFNPAADMELPRTPKSLPVDVLTADEIEKILSGINLQNTNGIRDRTILELLYSTGMRRKEMNNLFVSDIDFENKTILIREGKGRKDRYIPISERAIIWLKRYLDVRPKCIDNEDYLFLTDYGKKIQPGWLGYLVHCHVKNVRIGKTGSFLLFRHSVATLMLENGADIRYIQQILGHANLETTQIYTHVSIGKLKEVHEKTHPAKLSKFLEE